MENIQEENDSTVYPSLMNRIQAMFFDFWIIIAIVMLLSMTVFEAYADQFGGFRIVLFLLILFIYEPFGTMSGGTIGYRTMGLKVTKNDGISNISIIQAYKRSFVKSLLGSISFFSMTADAKRRAIHDKVADTLVLFRQKV